MTAKHHSSTAWDLLDGVLFHTPTSWCIISRPTPIFTIPPSEIIISISAGSSLTTWWAEQPSRTSKRALPSIAMKKKWLLLATWKLPGRRLAHARRPLPRRDQLHGRFSEPNSPGAHTRQHLHAALGKSLPIDAGAGGETSLTPNQKRHHLRTVGRQVYHRGSLWYLH